MSASMSRRTKDRLEVLKVVFQFTAVLISIGALLISVLSYRRADEVAQFNTRAVVTVVDAEIEYQPPTDQPGDAGSLYQPYQAQLCQASIRLTNSGGVKTQLLSAQAVVHVTENAFPFTDTRFELDTSIDQPVDTIFHASAGYLLDVASEFVPPLPVSLVPQEMVEIRPLVRVNLQSEDNELSARTGFKNALDKTLAVEYTLFFTDHEPVKLAPIECVYIHQR